MNKKEFSDLLEAIQLEEKLVRESGQSEYARGEDAFGNFNRIASTLGLDRKVVLSVYAAKHWDGILSYLIDGNKSQREDIRGRIKDLRMYLALLWGMLAEEELTFETLSVAGSTITTVVDNRTYSACGRTNCTGCPECEG